jgi:hypothetical protein
MKYITAAAVGVLLSSGMAFAQDNTQTGSTSGASNDPAAYLAGPNIQRFYTDDARTTLVPEADMKTQWNAMPEADRASLKQACSGNKDNRWSTLCNSIGSM